MNKLDQIITEVGGSEVAAAAGRDRRESACFGVHPMLFTAFDRQGRLNRPGHRTHGGRGDLRRRDGIAILGELSEFSRLSPRSSAG